MFAKLTGKFQFSPEPFVQTSGWQECTWVETCSAASKFAPEDAEKLAEQLRTEESGKTYTVERDKNGITNQPPYGLNNFVVRRID